MNLLMDEWSKLNTHGRAERKKESWMELYNFMYILSLIVQRLSCVGCVVEYGVYGR